jgi:phage protein D/phage baseplate assembly protein gpV
MADEYAAKPSIEIDGNVLPSEFELRLERAVVDDHTLLPDMFTLRFRDPDRDVVEKAGFEIGATVRILAAPQGKEATELLIMGELTALEAEFDASGSHVVARGYDHSHRLHRGRRTETYRNVTDADIARAVARRAGLETGRIDETATVHRHVSQANLSDWDFLAARSREAGCELAVVDGKLDFRQPADAGEAPQAGDLASEDPLQLVLGGGLDSFRPRVTSAEQVSQVEVRGWDPDRKQAVVGTAQAETVSASLSISPAELASKFGGPTFVVVDRPYSTQNEVDAAAKAIAEQVASSFAEAEGIARGDPKLKAGVAVSVGLAGRPFEGLYTITSSRHVFDNEGYRTHFFVSGRQVRSLLALTTGGNANGTTSGTSPISGVVTAQVTNVADSTGRGRVKLAFPWMSDTYESDWVRVVQAGAGKKRGFIVLPEVNDEVLVVFEHGDVRRPYVLGGLYNAEDVPGLDDVVEREKGEVVRRGFVSRKAHSIVFLDGDDEEGVTLATGDDGFRITLDQTGTTIKIESKGEVTIEASRDVSIRGRKLTLAAEAGVSIDAGSGNVTVKGQQIRLN